MLRNFSFLVCYFIALCSGEDELEEVHKYDMQLEQIWRENMQGFIPNDYVTVNLQPGDRIDLYSEFSIVGHKQRGAYFTDHNSIATLQVYDPVGNPIVSTIKR